MTTTTMLRNTTAPPLPNCTNRKTSADGNWTAKPGAKPPKDSTTPAAKRKRKRLRAINGEGDPGGGSPEGPQTTLFNTNSEIGAAFLKILVILIAAVALFFLLRGLLGMKGPRNRKVKTAELLGLSLEDIEENFQELALEDFIRNAVERKEFALAIRLYYLAVLKELATQELIRWKKDKTNLDYIHEMRPTELGAPFREITRIFEWAWYGRQTVSEEDFALLEPKMKGFLHRTSNVAAKGG
jgi:hypothetical protein